MIHTEIPYSVRVENDANPDFPTLSLEFDENKAKQTKPDTKSLSLSIDGIKVTEQDGQRKRGQEDISQRRLLLKKGNKEVPVTYDSSKDLAVLAFHPDSKDGKGSSHYLAKNGKYIEVGTLDTYGNITTVRYDDKSGYILDASTTIDSFKSFEMPMQIGIDKIDKIKDIFQSLKKSQTPLPTNIDYASSFVLSLVKTAEPSYQQALFEI
jgi:hypothetical protein